MNILKRKMTADIVEYFKKNIESVRESESLSFKYSPRESSAVLGCVYAPKTF